MTNSQVSVDDAKKLLTEIFYPSRLGGTRSRSSGLSVTAFSNYLTIAKRHLPGKKSRKYNSVREHLRNLVKNSSSDQFLLETLEVVHGFLIFKGRNDLSTKAETLLAGQGSERSGALKQRIFLNGGILLAYVADPSSYAHLRDDWRIMTMHGEDDLFRFSCAVFISEWLDSIDVNTSEPGVLNLAVDMSRVAFTYGDYHLAKRICSKIIFSPSAWDYSGPNLMSLFDAHRLHAEAVSFSRVSDGLMAFTFLYEDVSRRLMESEHLSEKQKYELQIRHDDVLIRTIVRLSLVNSVGDLAGRQNLRRVLESSKVLQALERLRDRLYRRSKASDDLVPKNDPDLRFIFFDTYIRSIAVLRNKDQEASKLLHAIRARHFSEEHQYEQCFRRHDKTPPPDMVKAYRLRTTEAMIRCYQVKRLIEGDDAINKIGGIKLLVRSTKQAIAQVLAPTDHATMQHTRNLAALLAEFLSSQESRLLDRVIKKA